MRETLPPSVASLHMPDNPCPSTHVLNHGLRAALSDRIDRLSLIDPETLPVGARLQIGRARSFTVALAPLFDAALGFPVTSRPLEAPTAEATHAGALPPDPKVQRVLYAIEQQQAGRAQDKDNVMPQVGLREGNELRLAIADGEPSPSAAAALQEANCHGCTPPLGSLWARPAPGRDALRAATAAIAARHESSPA